MLLQVIQQHAQPRGVAGTLGIDGVNADNESSELLRMFNSAFNPLLSAERAALDLYPEELRADIDTLNDWLYPRLNNGVYRTGFATTQLAYEEAVAALFDTLDQLERRLAASGPYLFGKRLTETDIRAFVTLIRFDIAYVGAFKANLRILADYPALARYTRRLYDHPDIGPTVDFRHIKQGYYSIRALNPQGIVPLGPETILDGMPVAG